MMGFEEHHYQRPLFVCVSLSFVFVCLLLYLFVCFFPIFAQNILSVSALPKSHCVHGV